MIKTFSYLRVHCHTRLARADFQAESNDVPTVRGYTAIRLEHIIRDLDIQTNGEDMLNVRKDVSPMSILYGETRGDDMELDDQYVRTLC